MTTLPAAVTTVEPVMMTMAPGIAIGILKALLIGDIMKFLKNCVEFFISAQIVETMKKPTKKYHHHNPYSSYGYSEPSYGYGEPSYGYEKPSYGYEKPSYGYEKPSSYGYEKPPYKKPSHKKPSYEPKPSYGYEEPKYTAPSHGYQQPSYDHHL